ncbi:MAG: hypothetical protein GY884_25420 [Proteobacteria bacterium]|nr:hypothetical protein [Pseudomonadota bacterium]
MGPLSELAGGAVIVLDARNGVLAAAASRPEQRELRRALRAPDTTSWTLVELGEGVGRLATKGAVGEGAKLLAEALRDAFEDVALRNEQDRQRHAHRVRAPAAEPPVRRSVWSDPAPGRQAALDGLE